MSKYTEFFEYVSDMVDSMPDDIRATFEELKATYEDEAKNKPLFTESGLEILKYLKTQEQKMMKAKDIASGLGTNSRKVSGAIRKLVSDGYVEKSGRNPVFYILTDQGKNFDITNYEKEINNDEED